ncbi:hypothetical protein BC830DRAFT_1169869 [Chytriomyces sp. MP71]|nr:hypothetical protein BC830DRAFT_1169869 [Chytriomyces sp. MP71]
MPLPSEDAMVQDLLRQITLFHSAFRDAAPFSSVSQPQSLSHSPILTRATSQPVSLVQTDYEAQDPFFADLAKDIRLRSFSPGDTILQEGEPAKCVFFIFRGTVEVVSADGELVLSVLEAGAYFGEIAVLFETTRVATVRCLSKCLLGVLMACDLHVQLQKYPKMKEIVIHEARERYAKVKMELEKAGKFVQNEVLDERKVSMVDIGRSTSTKSLDFPAGRRNSNLGLSVSLMNTPDSASAYSDQMEDDAIEEDDTNELPQVPCISIHPGNEPKRLAKQLSEGSDADPATGLGITLPLPANLYVSNLAMLHTSKRRASVAVWSDDKLMQLAQSTADKTSPSVSTTSAGRGGSGLSHSKFGTHTSVQDSPSQVSIEYSSSLADDAEKRVLQAFPNNISLLVLQHLDCRTLMRLRRASQDMLQFLDDSGPLLLEHVDLGPWNKKIDDATLLLILMFAGHSVKFLNLRNCWQVTDKGLQSISQCAPQIEWINLSSVWDVTDAGVAALARMTTNLHCIDLSNCRKLTDAAILSILTFSPNLDTIHLSYCKNLTDTCMDHPTWASVKSINLQRCTAITDVGFTTWASKSTLFSLRELILSDCSFLTDATVQHLATSAPHLVLLSLSFCCALSEASIPSLAEGCPSLRVLDLSFCGSAVTDASLDTLAARLAALERLSVRGCVQVSDRGLHALRACMRLRIVNVSQCRNIRTSPDVLRGEFGWTLLAGGELVTDGYGRKVWEDAGLLSMKHERALTT